MTNDRVLTRHSILEKEMKRIVKVYNTTKLEVSTKADYKIITISYNQPGVKDPIKQNESEKSSSDIQPGFKVITPKFKKTFKESLVDYEKEHLKLERQEKRYKQRDLEKIIAARLKQPRVTQPQNEVKEVKELKSDEIYKLDFDSEPSDLVGLGNAGDLAAKYGIRGTYFENMVVKLRFKRSAGDNLIQDVESSTSTAADEKELSEAKDVTNDKATQQESRKLRKTKRNTEKVLAKDTKAKPTTTTAPKISRSRAFGYPLPVFKKLDLDYSDAHWLILNEMGIF